MLIKSISFESNLIRWSFSHSLFFMVNLSTFKLTSWSLLVRKSHLSALPFKVFNLNQLNRDAEVCCRDYITLMTVAEVQGLLIVICKICNISIPMKNKSAKKMLNKSGPSIDPWVTLNTIASHSLYELFTLVLFSIWKTIIN